MSPAPVLGATDGRPGRGRRTWRIDAPVLALVAVVLRLPAFFASRSLVFDDGVFASSALAMRAGEAPFRDIFSSQGPLFLPLVWLADLRRVPHARRAAPARGRGGRAASPSRPTRAPAASRRAGNALLAAGLVTTSGSVLWVTGPINADGPSLALSVLAVALALRVPRRPAGSRPRSWVGLAAGAAVSIKALSVPAVVIAGLVRAAVAPPRRATRAGGGHRGSACTLVAALPWGSSGCGSSRSRTTTRHAARRRAAGASARSSTRCGTATCSCWSRSLLALGVFAAARTRRRFASHGDRVAAPGTRRRRRRARALGRAGVRAPRLGARAVARARRAPHPPARAAGGVAAAAVAGAAGRGGRGGAVLGDPEPLRSSGPTATRATKPALVTRLRALPGGRARHQRRPGPGVAGRARARPATSPTRRSSASTRGDITAALARRRGGVARDVCGVVVSSPQHFGRFAGLPAAARRRGLPRRAVRGPHHALRPQPGLRPVASVRRCSRRRAGRASAAAARVDHLAERHQLGGHVRARAARASPRGACPRCDRAPPRARAPRRSRWRRCRRA